MLINKLAGALIAVLACTAIAAGTASATDVSAPTVNWDNNDLSGVVVGARTLTVDVSDDTGVTAVEFDIAGALYAAATNNGDGTWSAPFDAADVAQGAVTITAVASDAAGNQGTAPISFTDSHDATAPAITATSPVVSDTLPTVIGTSLPVSVTATDNYAVTSADVSIDGEVTWQPLTFDALAGTWRATIDISSLDDGTNGVNFRVLDAAGNESDEFAVIDLVKVPTVPVLTVTAPADAYSVENRPIQAGDYLVSYSSADATGAPVPNITYQWRVCPALTSIASACTTTDSFGIQLADGDAGKYLKLVTTATNVAGSDVNVLDLGVIAAAPVYVEPTPPAPVASTPAPELQTAPVAVAPAVTAPVAEPAPTSVGIAPAVTIAEQAVAASQEQVAASATVVARAGAAQTAAVDRLSAAKQRLATAKAAVRTGGATPAEQKALAGAQKSVDGAQSKVLAKAIAATKKKAELASAQKTLAGKQSALSTLTGSAPAAPAKPAKAVAAAQHAVAQADAAEKAAVAQYLEARAHVVSAAKAVSTGATTIAERKNLASAQKTVATRTSTVVATAVADSAATAKLAVVKQAPAPKQPGK